MRKFNLFNEIIVVDKNELLNAINTNTEFAIDISGAIKFEPFSDDLIAIFKGKANKPSMLSVTPPTIASMLDSSYKIVEDENRVLIKAFGLWQNIININRLNATYDDTSADGIDRFAIKELEQIGWHATEFNITYREIVDMLEEHADGVILCIEQAEPYQFSGLGFISDKNQALEIANSYCKQKISHLLKNDSDYSTLSDDESEAAEFFNLL